MMPSKEEIREAVKIVKHVAFQYSEEKDKVQEALKPLVDLAESLLSVEGLPEEKMSTFQEIIIYSEGFKDAYHKWEAAVAKDYVRKDRLLTGYEVLTSMLHAKHPTGLPLLPNYHHCLREVYTEEWKQTKAILARQKEKIEGGK